MLKYLTVICVFASSLPVFGNDQLKQEITDLINSNREFYTKIVPGMGFTGEMVSDLVDENGNYQNCTIALRGKNILLNNTLDALEYSYQEHWIDINIREGNTCDPEMYPQEHRRFIQMSKKRDPLELLNLLQTQSDLTIEKLAAKEYVLKYTVLDEQNEEISINAKYDLNFPLYMNPNTNGFNNQYFDYSLINLDSIALCQPSEEGGDCSNEQDLNYLLKR